MNSEHDFFHNGNAQIIAVRMAAAFTRGIVQYRYKVIMKVVSCSWVSWFFVTERVVDVYKLFFGIFGIFYARFGYGRSRKLFSLPSILH